MRGWGRRVWAGGLIWWWHDLKGESALTHGRCIVTALACGLMQHQLSRYSLDPWQYRVCECTQATKGKQWRAPGFVVIQNPANCCRAVSRSLLIQPSIGCYYTASRPESALSPRAISNGTDGLAVSNTSPKRN